MADRLSNLYAIPGIRAASITEWGAVVGGKREALIASGLVESDWFPDLSARTPTGRPIRDRTTLVGGLPVCVSEWTRDDDQWLVSFHNAPQSRNQQRRSATLRGRYDGRNVTAWADCAWQPKPQRRRRAAKSAGA